MQPNLHLSDADLRCTVDWSLRLSERVLTLRRLIEVSNRLHITANNYIVSKFNIRGGEKFMNIKKAIVSSAAAVALLMASAIPALAVKPNGPSAVNGLAHPGQASQLYLYEKDANWNAVEGGAWGKMTFGDEFFVFNGHELTPGEEYSLINYVDPWPGTTSALLASGTADADGNIHLSGDLTSVLSGKVWLVLSSDFTEGTGMTGWHPAENLFEYKVI